MPMYQMAGGLLVGGRYRLHSILGQGGMGVVWRALDVNLDRSVAVKILRVDLLESTAARRRVEREARLSGRVANPHVVTLLDVGEHEGKTPYLVFELLRGETLRERIARVGRLPWRAAVDVARQIASALASAHREAVVHRDLKPGNVMLLDDDIAHDFVKVLDFGIARPMTQGDDDVTSTDDRLICSPAYVAPELVDGRDVAPASDLYALGVVLHEMLTGDNPFRAETTFKTLTRHVEQKAPPIDASLDVPRALAILVESLLEKSPDDRPAGARVVRDALSDIAAGRHVDVRDGSLARHVVAEAVSEPTKGGPKTRRVLIIDDDEAYSELTRQRLELAGYDVAVQPGPFGSLHAMRSGDFDVVILDVNMPGLTGTKILDMLPRDEARPKVLLVSNVDERALAELARRHGADGHVWKSAERDALVSRVAKAIDEEAVDKKGIDP